MSILKKIRHKISSDNKKKVAISPLFYSNYSNKGKNNNNVFPSRLLVIIGNNHHQNTSGDKTSG